MAIEDRIKWNSKFSLGGLKPGVPEPFLVEHHAVFEDGLALDLACGDGRNGLFLAQQGYQVTGVDISDVALQRFAEFASKMNLNVHLMAVDLEEGLHPEALPCFDNLLICCYKPVPSLWSHLIERLPAHGRVMVATFNLKQSLKKGFPAKFCLSEKEYYQLHRDLEIEVYETREDNDRFMDFYILKKTGKS